ncbi:hypothetical protein E2C01_086519 [Portunus trituberculatus]|uniref:Uncharacterized protein n=1 Tax=Portunus trituberculatus TaxID=210409 RepID=A0A5B7J9I3_PORTR|nr:hypothetical protein [Portunus trituberculatus]
MVVVEEVVVIRRREEGHCGEIKEREFFSYFSVASLQLRYFILVEVVEV